ncbi:flagellar hook-length control protein FliK [Roseateles amylovorans]|uniref:Flagellar hook-length control protein FliK n=1 Tax=Roseateles amylovorans TaxID=2978473 RepID=A0ABY6B317_9BURK|nr:flagellar hook-length control protein FliK [Roseateles amylovorans]UXH79783.1 flagellar hook-length control protein FliK [Roseateles amylovorans]
MSLIQQNTPLFGTNGAVGALGVNANGRKEGANNAHAGTPPFSQWLNQSSQQMKAPVPVPTPPAPAPTPTPQASAQSAKAPAPRPENAASQDENKLAARNAANRTAANRQSDTPKSPAKPASKDGPATDAAASDAANAADTARANAAKGSQETGGEVQARDAKSSDEATPDDSKTDATATPAQQILAMLRGEAPPEAKLDARAVVTQGDQPDAKAADTAISGNPHGKPGHAGALQDARQLQQELRQAARGEAMDAATQADGLEAAQSSHGAHEVAMTDAKPANGAPAHSFEALLAAAQGGASSSVGGGAASSRSEAPTVPLSQPMHSPDFAPELSASVSLLIQDGVHEAQLQLNPAEMGPVAIHIQVDGQQAQVNFHAEQAATRDVLERSLPDLAAALQSQGLTLSGGGVFAQQQSGSDQNGRESQGERGSRRGGAGSQDDGGLAGAGRAERRTPPRGLVDLYA